MKVHCTGCGGDCSHAYGTWMGDPYHFGCIPMPRRRKKLSAAEQLRNIEDAMVEDIMALSPEELRAEFIEDGLDPDKVAEETRAIIDRAIAKAKEA